MYPLWVRIGWVASTCGCLMCFAGSGVVDAGESEVEVLEREDGEGEGKEAGSGE